MGASVFVTKRGGKIVTCAATTGYMIEYDNRHLWMRLKQIVSSHFANYAEAWAMNRLLDTGAIQPILSKTFDLAEVGEAAYQVHHNLHEGKLGVLCLASGQGQGITDLDKRASIGEDKITLFQRHARSLETAS
jgi:crotonyl-CoA reductase